MLNVSKAEIHENSMKQLITIVTHKFVLGNKQVN